MRGGVGGRLAPAKLDTTVFTPGMAATSLIASASSLIDSSSEIDGPGLSQE